MKNQFRSTLVASVLLSLMIGGCASSKKEADVPLNSIPTMVGTGDPWIVAARSNDIVTLQNMVAAGRPIDAATKVGTTALMVAARSGHYETTKWLLSQGAVASRVDQDGQSALVYALVGTASGLKLQLVVEELIKGGANPFAIDRLEFQPIQEMLEKDMDDVIRKVKFTDKKPCDLAPAREGEVSLSKAARRRGKIALAEFLEREGCW